MSRSLRAFLITITIINILIFSGVIFVITGEKAADVVDPLPSVYAEGLKTTSGERRTPVVNVAEQISPAVVTIGAIRTAYARRFDPMFNNFFAPYIVYPYKEKLPYLGSGFIINSEGYVLTNYHVIEGAEKVLVTLMDGRELEAEVLDADQVVDVALLKIKEEGDYPSCQLGDSSDLLIGESVVAIGNPFGNLIEDSHPTVTAGVVSAINRSFKPESSSYRVYSDMIQTDAAINPGNSGGPLVNMAGEVIGINTFIVSRSGASHGIGMAIPINKARSVAKEIIKFGRIRPLWRDFDCINITPHLQSVLDAPDRKGVVIRRMEREGPAQKSGLEVGDIIKKVNEKEVNKCTDLIAYFSSYQVGDLLELQILRDGKVKTIEYTIEEFKSKENL